VEKFAVRKERRKILNEHAAGLLCRTTQVTQLSVTLVWHVKVKRCGDGAVTCVCQQPDWEQCSKL